MQNVDAKPASILDKSFASLLRWDAEKLLWAILLILTVLSRVIGLGDRAMSHDESLHTVYSWQLYDGRGYQHQPMMHGPLKFILNALAYFTFGVDDWSSRIQVAIFGIASGVAGLLLQAMDGQSRRARYRADAGDLARAALLQPLHP